MIEKIAVLYARQDSIYKNYDLEVFDSVRNAYNYTGSAPVICHPPCRAWSRLRSFSKHDLSELGTAFHAFTLVKQNGGVFEHPSSSLFFKKYILSQKSNFQHKEFVVGVDQSWFGHKAKKNTWLFVSGISHADLPPYPLSMDAIQHTVSTSKKSKSGKKLNPKREISKADRERTPKLFAEWLISIAEKCRRT